VAPQSAEGENDVFSQSVHGADYQSPFCAYGSFSDKAQDFQMNVR
jgi:hypothetical protein